MSSFQLLGNTGVLALMNTFAYSSFPNAYTMEMNILDTMTPETTIVFNVGVGAILIGIVTFMLALVAVVWKGKKEISQTIREELEPTKRAGNKSALAVNELQTYLRNKFKGTTFVHTLVEKGTSPLKPTEFGASLIKDSGLKDILDTNKAILRTKLEAILPTGYTEYDVQEKARDLLISLVDDPMMNPVKEYVYKNPSDIKTILRVGGLWLRDDFMNAPREVAKEENAKA